METPLTLLAEALAGFLAAYVSSIPQAGPVALLILDHGLAGRTSRARRLALGAALAEAAWVAVVSFGVGPLLWQDPAAARLARAASGALLLALALLALRRPAAAPTPRPAGDVTLGLALVALNPGFVAAWTALASALEAWGLLGAAAAPGLAFVAGAFLGVLGWFATLLALAARLGPRLSTGGLSRLRRFGALALGALGLALLVRAALG